MLKFKYKKKIIRFVPSKIYRTVVEFFRHYFIELFKRIDKHNLFLSGAGISYSILLGMIPLVLLLFSLLGNIFDTETLQSQINQIIDTTIPYPVYADYTKKIISSRLPEAYEYKNLAAFIGIVGLIFTSTWIFSSMRTILNEIFHTDVEKHALVGVLRDVGMVLLLIIFITLSTFIFPALNLIVEEADKSILFKAYDLTSVWNTVVRLSSIAVMFLMFFSLYYLIPYEKLQKRVAGLSAFWTTILWEVARNIFGYYIKNFLGSNAIYGAFVLIVVILLWIFYSSCIFIVGAEIGQLFRERRNQKDQLNFSDDL